MAYETFYDEKIGMVRLNLKGQWGSGREFAEAVSMMNSLLDEREKRIVICDLSQGSFQSYTKEFRQSVARTAKNVEIEKAAITGASPVLRMMAKMLLAAARTLNPELPEVRFFNLEEEALEWLKGEES
ncbi:hypothetical protein GX441_03530 [bacterium]|nr:hypothetical protein [bacterium]